MDVGILQRGSHGSNPCLHTELVGCDATCRTWDLSGVPRSIWSRRLDFQDRSDPLSIVVAYVTVGVTGLLSFFVPMLLEHLESAPMRRLKEFKNLGTKLSATLQADHIQEFPPIFEGNGKHKDERLYS